MSISICKGGWREVAPAGHCRCFQREVDDGHLTALVAREPSEDGRLNWHLSISHHKNI